MEYRIERDSMGEMKVPADKYWARADAAQFTRILKSAREVMPREIIACVRDTEESGGDREF